MIFLEYNFKDKKGNDIYITAWKPTGEAKRILHIVHGMTEHIGRYEVFAKRLNESGTLVIGMDLPGHGRSNTKAKCATLGETGWDDTLINIEYINSVLSKRYTGIPLIMLGFSLGSFIIRDYMAKGPNMVSGAVIAGTGSQPSAVLTMLKKVVCGQIKKVGFNNPSELVTNLSFGTYNKKFTPTRTIADWLCSDEDEIDKYLNDELSKPEISTGLFYQMLDGMQRTGKLDIYNNWNKDNKILLISGTDDPVGSNGKGVESVKKQMEKAGIKDVKMQLIENCRHDIFHEISNGGFDKVCKVIIDFIG